MTTVYDVAVIGAGVIGAATAYYNAKRGAKVVLIDAGDMAEGTSSRCDGNLYCTGRMANAAAMLAHVSQILTADLSRELDYDFEWGQRGSLSVAENEFEWDVLQKLYKSFCAIGVPVSLLDRKELQDDEPNLAKDLYGGVLTHTSGCVYPMGYVYALGMGMQKLGGKLELHTRVENILVHTSEKEFTIVTDKGNIVAKNVVNCGGVWSKQIGQMVGLDIPVEPRHGLILVSEQTIKPGRRKVWECGYMAAQFAGSGEFERSLTPEMMKYGIAFVYEPTSNNNFVLGSSRYFSGFSTASRIEIMKNIAQRGIRFYPCLKDVKVIRSYAGVRPFVADHKPIISDTRIPGFYVATGHEGEGIALSAITGYMISQMILGEPTLLDCSSMSMSRFDDSNSAVHSG